MCCYWPFTHSDQCCFTALLEREKGRGGGAKVILRLAALPWRLTFAGGGLQCCSRISLKCASFRITLYTPAYKLAIDWVYPLKYGTLQSSIFKVICFLRTGGHCLVSCYYYCTELEEILFIVALTGGEEEEGGGRGREEEGMSKRTATLPTTQVFTDSLIFLNLSMRDTSYSPMLTLWPTQQIALSIMDTHHSCIINLDLQIKDTSLSRTIPPQWLVYFSFRSVARPPFSSSGDIN